MENWKEHAIWALSLLTTIGLALLGSGSPLIGTKATLILTLVLAVLTAVVRFLNTGEAPSPQSQVQTLNGPGVGGYAPITGRTSSTTTSTSANVVVKLLLLALLLPLVMTTACKTNAPLPPGALTAPDATIDATLAGASAAVTQYEKDVAAGFVPSAALKATMQTIQQALAVAVPAYQAWHAALATAPELRGG